MTRIVPAGWMKGLYDRKLQPIVADRDGHEGSDLPVPAALAARLADAGPDSTITGTIEAVDDRGVPVLVAFRRSGATNWTSAVAVPLADLNAPVDGCPVADGRTGGSPPARRRGSPPGSRPARSSSRSGSLSDQVTGAKKQVSELSGQLLALQEEERQRIARELHDSTAQHLVAANLGLASLEGAVSQIPAGRRALAEVEGLLDRGAAGIAHLHLPAASAEPGAGRSPGHVAGFCRRLRGADGARRPDPDSGGGRRPAAGAPAGDPARGAGGAHQRASPCRCLARVGQGPDSCPDGWSSASATTDMG